MCFKAHRRHAPRVTAIPGSKICRDCEANSFMLIQFSRVRTCGALVPCPHALGTEEALVCCCRCLLRGGTEFKPAYSLAPWLYDPLKTVISFATDVRVHYTLLFAF
jgi:hypothetical protein